MTDTSESKVPKAHEIWNLLKRIQERSGLDRRDGHPLYLYRANADDLAELKQHIKHRLWRDRERLNDIVDCAGFCLFAADQFRRHHTDGVWKWETIIGKGLGIWDPTLHYYHDAIGKGLRWWGRDLIRTENSRRFLLTLACEGGLPLKLVQKHGGNLRSFLSAVLRDYERYPDTLLQETVADHIYRLPR